MAYVSRTPIASHLVSLLCAQLALGCLVRSSRPSRLGCSVWATSAPPSPTQALRVSVVPSSRVSQTAFYSGKQVIAGCAWTGKSHLLMLVLQRIKAADCTRLVNGLDCPLPSGRHCRIVVGQKSDMPPRKWPLASASSPPRPSIGYAAPTSTSQ